MSKRKHNYEFDSARIGLAIKKAREAVKIKREPAAEILGISPRHLQAIELEGQHPSYELFIHIITEFKVSVDAIIFPENAAGKSSVRKRVNRLLDSLDDRELTIIEGTAKAVLEARALGD